MPRTESRTPGNPSIAVSCPGSMMADGSLVIATSQARCAVTKRVYAVWVRRAPADAAMTTPPLTPTNSASDSAARQRVRSSDHVRSQTMGKIVRRRASGRKGAHSSPVRGGSTPGCDPEHGDGPVPVGDDGAPPCVIDRA